MHQHQDTITRQAVWAASVGMFLDGFDLSIMAIALLPLRTQWHLDAAAVGGLMASALIGSLLGGIAGGLLTDRFGRRALLLPNILLYILGALVSALSPTLIWLVLGRLIIGLGVGMDYPLVATVIAEYSADRQRGNRFAWANIAWYVGALASTVVGLLLLPVGIMSWRIMFATAVAPAIVLLWLRRHLPESPRWLARMGRTEAARGALGILHPTWPIARVTAALASYRGTVQRATVLLHRPWRRRLVLGLVPWFCLDVVGLGIGLYFPVVLRMQGLATSNVAAAGINAIFLLISMAGIAFVLKRLDRWGRIRLQVIGFAQMAGGLFLFAVGIAIGSAVAVYTGAAIYAFGTGMGPAVTAMALSVEIFPTELRASVGGLATAFSRLGAAVSAVVFPTLDASLGLAPVLIVMGGIALLGAVVTRAYRLEPAGRTLESMENGTDAFASAPDTQHIRPH